MKIVATIPCYNPPSDMTAKHIRLDLRVGVGMHVYLGESRVEKIP